MPHIALPENLPGITTADVEQAREAGATDTEIHDTVLIAAAFCMYNRYVDGLATWTPTDHEACDQMGHRMAHEGYVRRTTPPIAAPAGSV